MEESKIGELSMKKRIPMFITLHIILAITFCWTVYAKDPGSGPKVAIAWSNTQDGYAFTGLLATMKETGADFEVLDMAKSYDLSYDKENQLIDAKDSNGILTSEAAKLVKNNTWIGSNTEELMEGYDCIIFPGGVDISPTLFYEEQEWHGIEEDTDYCAERDVSDYILLSYCLEHDIPILGICRGMQMLSIVSGADIVQDLEAYYQEQDLEYHDEHRDPEKKDVVCHSVKLVTDESFLYDAYGTLILEGCPSWHHQAVKDVSNTRLTVTAETYTDGIPLIEGVERYDQTFCAGVQFHPEIAVKKYLENAPDADEYMDYDTAMSLFYELIKAGDRHQSEEIAA